MPPADPDLPLLDVALARASQLAPDEQLAAMNRVLDRNPALKTSLAAALSKISSGETLVATMRRRDDPTAQSLALLVVTDVDPTAATSLFLPGRERRPGAHRAQPSPRGARGPRARHDRPIRCRGPRSPSHARGRRDSIRPVRSAGGAGDRRASPGQEARSRARALGERSRLAAPWARRRPRSRGLEARARAGAVRAGGASRECDEATCPCGAALARALRGRRARGGVARDARDRHGGVRARGRCVRHFRHDAPREAGHRARRRDPARRLLPVRRGPFAWPEQGPRDGSHRHREDARLPVAALVSRVSRDRGPGRSSPALHRDGIVGVQLPFVERSVAGRAIRHPPSRAISS